MHYLTAEKVNRGSKKDNLMASSVSQAWGGYELKLVQVACSIEKQAFQHGLMLGGIGRVHSTGQQLR